jgi:hypothetical protein
VIARSGALVMLGTVLFGCAEQAPPQAPPPLRAASGPTPQPVARAELAPAAPEQQSAQLAGLWRGQARDRGFRGERALSQWELLLSGDGSYRSTLTYPAGGTLRHWGRFVHGPGFIRLALEGWDPREECGDSGCVALSLPPLDTIVLAEISATQIVTERGVLQRVR